MNRIILFIIVVIFILFGNLERFNSNLDFDSKTINKLYYINKKYFSNKGKLYRENSIKFTKNNINDNRVIYALYFGDTTKENKNEEISNNKLKKIIKMILPKYLNYFKLKKKQRVEELIIGLDKSTGVKKLYIRTNKILRCVECKNNKCKKKKYFEDVKIPLKILKIKLNKIYKDNYSILDDLIKTKNVQVHMKEENRRINYYHILLSSFNIKLEKYKNKFKKFINNRYPNLKLNNVFEKYKDSTVSYFSLGDNGITLYIDQIFYQN